MNDRLPGTTWDNPIWYRGFRIFINDQWFGAHDAYAYVHDDFDGAPDAYDNRHGTAATIEDCKTEIDDRFFEDELPYVKKYPHRGCILITAVVVCWIVIAAIFALWHSPKAWQTGYKACVNAERNGWIDCPRVRRNG